MRLALLLLLMAAGATAIDIDRRIGSPQLSTALPEYYLAVLEALGSSPSVREQLAFLTINQTITVPTVVEPVPVLPACPDSVALSRALAAAIDTHFAQLLVRNATVDTTCIQRVDECSFSSFISYSGSPSVRDALVAAANSQQLCALLPGYCAALRLKPAGASGSEPNVLDASVGDASPPLPPVLEYNCIKHNFTQVLDHFAPPSQQQAGSSPGTFRQVYWVCDAAWPSTPAEQEAKGSVVVFLGNESPLGVPRQPIVFENARRAHALVVLVEHRYYGESVPFPAGPNGALTTQQYKWLTIEQVIEDTATVLDAVRKALAVPEVPTVVIGGSYGGQLAAYHRVVKPHVFHAAVAASAPIRYPTGTPMWRRDSTRYHQFIWDSVQTMGSPACASGVRDGLSQLQELGESAEGRAMLASMFRLCGGAAALPTKESATRALLLWILGNWQSPFVQVNNQPSLLGQVSLACSIFEGARAQAVSRQSALDAVAGLAAVNTYFFSNASAAWCYPFVWNASTLLMPGAPNAYDYQCCAQGATNSWLLPAAAQPDTLNPKPLVVTQAEVEANCRAKFGPSVPPMRVPSFMANIFRDLQQVGGVVFTNGNLDGWAGGSVGVDPASVRPSGDASGRQLLVHRGPQPADLAAVAAGAPATAASDAAGGRQSRRARKQHKHKKAHRRGGKDSDNGDEGDDEGEGYHGGEGNGGGGGDHHTKPLVSFVVYHNASHCTDTHTFAWGEPGEPSLWRRQRTRALTRALEFAARELAPARRGPAAPV